MGTVEQDTERQECTERPTDAKSQGNAVTVLATPSNDIDRRIIDFIGRHHVMTIATVDECGGAYCANLFYSFSERMEAFVFTTDPATRHGGDMAAGRGVAASIVLETGMVGKVRGLQICGHAMRPEGEELAEARKNYLLRFPYAVAAKLDLWLLRPDFMKYTDNRLGFGKKIIWRKDV